MITNIKIDRGYLITEWDGELASVQVIHLDAHTVIMRYQDGVAHDVSIEYFHSLGPMEEVFA